MKDDLLMRSCPTNSPFHLGANFQRVFEAWLCPQCHLLSHQPRISRLYPPGSHFGSNLIEDAGAGFECTDALCRHTFHYVPINDAVDESLTRLQYIILQDELSWRGEQISQGALMRARCEIVQHAQALSWAIDPLALCSVPWTEDAVKTIHKILYNNMADEDVIPGEYRGPDHPIAAKHIDTTTGKATISRFIHPRAVSSYMAAWVEDLNEDIRRAESGPPFDPYDLAARYYHGFINIHPF